MINLVGLPLIALLYLESSKKPFTIQTKVLTIYTKKKASLALDLIAEWKHTTFNRYQGIHISDSILYDPH